FFQAEDGIRDKLVTGVQTCALPIFEKRRACGDADGVEQRFCDARRDAAHDGVVCVGADGLAPARDLELLERVAHSSSSAARTREIGRASCRERGKSSRGAGAVEKKR